MTVKIFIYEVKWVKFWSLWCQYIKKYMYSNAFVFCFICLQSVSVNLQSTVCKCFVIPCHITLPGPILVLKFCEINSDLVSWFKLRFTGSGNKQCNLKSNSTLIYFQTFHTIKLNFACSHLVSFPRGPNSGHQSSFWCVLKLSEPEPSQF